MSDPPKDAITISMPPDPRWVRTIRLATSGMAATGPFDVETIDDLRIAVDELCAALIEAGGQSRIDLELRCADGVFEVQGRTRAGAPVDGAIGSDPEDRFALSRQILSVVSDDFGLDLGGETVRCWFRRAAPPELVEATAGDAGVPTEDGARGEAAGGR